MKRLSYLLIVLIITTVVSAQACDFEYSQAYDSSFPNWVASGNVDDGDVICLVPDGAHNVFQFNVNAPLIIDGINFTLTADPADDIIIEFAGTASAEAPLVTLTNVNEGMIIENITFRNVAPATGHNWDGGALYIDGYPTIRNCKFLSNTVGHSSSTEYRKGGAIYVVGQVGNSAVIDGCIFEDNHAYGSGGAIFSVYTEIGHCRFTDNSATSTLNSSYPGSILDLESTEVSFSVLKGNTVSTSGYSYGIVMGRAGSFINRSVLYGNSQPGFRSVSTLNPGAEGTIIKTSGTGNTNLVGYALYCTTINYCLVDDQYHATSYGTGNLADETDPLFLDSSQNDFRLLPGSPCINQVNSSQDPDGTNSDIGSEYYPLVRFVDDNQPNIQDAVDANYNGAPIEIDLSYDYALPVSVSDQVTHPDPSLSFEIRRATGSDWAFTANPGIMSNIFVNGCSAGLKLKDLEFDWNLGPTIEITRAVRVYDSAVTFDGCEFSDYGSNYTGTPPYSGGSVYASVGNGQVLRFLDCVFNNSKAPQNGGAVFAGGYALKMGPESRVLTDSETHRQVSFMGCEATDGAGGAIYATAMPSSPDSWINHSMFLGNSANSDADACCFASTSGSSQDVTIWNSVFTYDDNPALLFSTLQDVRLDKCTVYSADATPPAAVEVSGVRHVTGYNSIFHSTISGTPTDFNLHYCNFVTGTNPDPNGTHNISADPNYVETNLTANTTQNFHIKWNSACLDRGIPTSLTSMDYDHTAPDIGYHRVYPIIILDANSDLDLAIGWYHATGNIDYTGDADIPAGSVVRFDDGVTVDVSSSSGIYHGYTIGAPDNERTSITQEIANPANGTGSFEITGNNGGISADQDALDVHHLRYDYGDGDLRFNKLMLDVDDLNFVNGTNRIVLGNDCEDCVINSSFRNSDQPHQVVMLYNSVYLKNCVLEEYGTYGLMTSGCTTPANHPMEELDIDGINQSSNSDIGMLTLNSSYRLVESLINNHDAAAIKLSMGTADLSDCAHNNLDDNNTEGNEALIYQMGKPSLVDLSCGYNSLVREYSTHFFVKDFSNQTYSSTDVANNYWGSSDPSFDPSAYLPSSWQPITYSPILTTWETPQDPCPCSGGSGTKGTSSDKDGSGSQTCGDGDGYDLYQQALSAESDGDFLSARLIYAQLIREYSASGAALEAVYRLRYIGHTVADQSTPVLALMADLRDELSETTGSILPTLNGLYFWLYGVHTDAETAMTGLQDLLDNTDDSNWTLFYSELLLYLSVFHQPGGTVGLTQAGPTLCHQQDLYLEELDRLLVESGVSDESTVPGHLELDQNYPNPFNPVTTIRYNLVYNTAVQLHVYDVQGCHIMTLANGEQTAGQHTVMFDGSSLASGVYFYRLTAGNQSLTRKMILVK